MVYKLTPSSHYSVNWVYSENDLPCNCCSPTIAMEYGKWDCVIQERSWFVVDEPTECWADMADAELAHRDASMTEAQKAEVLAQVAAQEAEAELAREASRMFSYAEEQKYRNTKGKGKERHIDKVDEPCKWLYCNEKAPKSLWTVNKKGERCAPLLNHLSGAECWAHEYHDPKSKKLLTPHTCKRLHPKEDGWRDEWNTNRCYKPSAADGFFAQRMATQQAPSRPAAPRKPMGAVSNTAW